MSYVPHEWKKGDKITAERLNNIEEGIAEVKENDNNSQLELDKIILTLSYDSHSNEYTGTANTDLNTAISLINNYKDIIIENDYEDFKNIIYPFQISVSNNSINCIYLAEGDQQLLIYNIFWDSQGISVYSQFDINADTTY